MGNLYSKTFEFLKTFTLRRREKKYSVNRFRPDHPELNFSNQSIPVKDKKQTETSAVQVPITDNEQTKTSTAPDPVVNQVAPLKTCSAFYWACRTNDIKKVKKLLETISQDEIDQLEPNNSTALHAASYHGHADIVKLLLERGADRSIFNRYGCLPFDEAPNDGIREIFLRTPSSNRLVMNTGAIEWELVEVDALETAMVEQQMIKSLYKKVPVDKMFEKIETNYINRGLANMDKIESIKHFFQKATNEKDPIWIIKAYTAETDFYNVLNTEIAAGASRYQNERKFIIALFSCHPKLDKLSYIGTSYRVMKVTDYDLKKYEINCLSMTKSFLSSSTDEEIAACFLYRQEVKQENNQTRIRFNKHGQLIKSWVMCKYQIKHPRTALHIENSSQYTAEAEVLVMPYTVFRVKSKEIVAAPYLLDGQQINVIEFEECEPNIDTQIQDT